MFQVLKRFAPVCAFVAPMFLPAVTFAQSAGASSVAYQIDPAHTGVTQFTPALQLPLGRLWQVDLGGDVSYPLIADGKVFVTYLPWDDSTHKVLALDETTGDALWSATVFPGAVPRANMAYDNGRLFLVNFDGLLQALDADDGDVAWSVRLPLQSAFTAPPTAVDGIVYVGGAGFGGTLYALDESNGALLWSESVENGDDSSPAIYNGSVYVSYVCTQIYSFDDLTGDELWHYSGTCEGGGGHTPVVKGGKLYVHDDDANPSGFVFDAITGTLLDRFDASDTPVIGATTGYYLQSGTLRGIDLAGGSVLWSFAGDGHFESSPVVVDDYAFIGSTMGNLYAVNTRTGAVGWSTQVGAAIGAYAAGQVTGLGAGDGIVVVPASNLLTAYRSVSDSIFVDGFESRHP